MSHSREITAAIHAFAHDCEAGAAANYEAARADDSTGQFRAGVAVAYDEVARELRTLLDQARPPARVWQAGEPIPAGTWVLDDEHRVFHVGLDDDPPGSPIVLNGSSAVVEVVPPDHAAAVAAAAKAEVQAHDPPAASGPNPAPGSDQSLAALAALIAEAAINLFLDHRDQDGQDPIIALANAVREIAEGVSIRFAGADPGSGGGTGILVDLNADLRPVPRPPAAGAGQPRCPDCGRPAVVGMVSAFFPDPQAACTEPELCGWSGTPSETRDTEAATTSAPACRTCWQPLHDVDGTWQHLRSPRTLGQASHPAVATCATCGEPINPDSARAGFYPHVDPFLDSVHAATPATAAGTPAGEEASDR